MIFAYRTLILSSSLHLAPRILILAVILFFISTMVLVVKRSREKDYILRLQKRITAHPYEKALSIFIFLITSLHTFILSVVLSPFRCYPQADGTSTLIPKPSEDCYGFTWRRNLPFIVFGLFQILAIPCFLLYICWNFKAQKSNNFFLWRYGILFRPYKDEVFYWEVIVMLRKTFFVLLVDISNGLKKSLRIYLTMLFLLMSFLAEGLLRPHQKQGVSTFTAMS
jgi:hypothetical protein